MQCPIAKSRTKRGRPEAPSAIHGPLVLKFLPLDKASGFADWLENQYEENHERRVEAQAQALLEAVDDSPPEKVRPLWHTKTNQISQAMKGQRNWWHSKRMP
jgi:hypothetical protein